MSRLPEIIVIRGWEEHDSVERAEASSGGLESSCGSLANFLWNPEQVLNGSYPQLSYLDNG
jgi:hypothetical protein